MYTLIKGRVCLEVDMALVADLGPPAVLGEEALVEPNARCHFTLRSKFLCFFQVVTAADAANVFARFPEDRDRMQETAMENAESLKRIRLRNMHRRIEPTSSSSEQVSHQEEHKKDTQQQDVPNDVPTTEALRTFFKDSDPGFLEFISEHLEKCIFFGGQILLHEGSEGNFMWLLQRGKLVVEVGGMRVGEVQEGGYIGEAVLLGQAVRRTATCRAVGLVTAFKLESSVVLEAFELFPKEKSRVEQMMKLRERSNKFLASCNADGNSGQASIPLPLGSTAVKGASKILSKMSRSGKKRSSSIGGVVVRRGGTSSPAVAASGMSSPIARPPSDEPVKSLKGKPTAPTSPAGKLRVPSFSSLPGEISPARDNSTHSLRSVSSSENPTADQKSPVTKSQAEPARQTVTILPRSSRSSEWALRRQTAVQGADLHRDLRLAQCGALMPLVPPDQGYQPSWSPQNGLEALQKQGTNATCAVWKRRLQKVRGLYSRPVWHNAKVGSY